MEKEVSTCVLIIVLFLSISAAGMEVESMLRPEGWSSDTHGECIEPDYLIVFPEDRVNRIDIRIDPDDWSVMMSDMTELYGEFGARASMPMFRPAERSTGFPGMPPFPDRPPPGSPDPMEQCGPLSEAIDNPVWVPADLVFNGSIWMHVGIRFKGNSSLRETWSRGNLKLPMKLDFDQFEDRYPLIDDQRFYGFRQLTLSSNFSDPSLLRERVTADIFRGAGVPAPRTAFVRVYLDHGDGSVYFGLYTMVEVVDDTMIRTAFGTDSGNVYKPEGWGASFEEGSFTKAAFDKETNREEGDWSDILALYEALHADDRLTNPCAWRSRLESVFDVDGFLQWLAVNVLVQNWDTYGRTVHNYFLYNVPETGVLAWIPWDNNMALRDDIGHFPVLTLSLAEVEANWPLIRFLMDDPEYRTRYISNIATVIEGPFEPDGMVEEYRRLHELIQPWVTGAEGEVEGCTHLSSPRQFDGALEALVEHVHSRHAEATDFLEANR
jgi:hypothetical protein